MAATAYIYPTYSGVYKKDDSYATAWNAGTAQGTTPGIGQYYFSPGVGDYSIQRATLYYDTSIIPNNATILSASLTFERDGNYSDTDFDMVIQNMDGAPDDLTRYNKNNFSGNGGQLSTSGLGSTFYIVLDETGLSWINKEGITKLGVRSSRDITGITPSGLEYITFKSGDYLRVTWEVSAEPVVTTQAATEIGYQAAMGNGTIVSSTNATERGFEVKLSFSSTLNDYIQHRIAGFLGDVTFSSATNWSGTLTKTETDTGDFAEGAYELVLGYPSVLGNPSSVFSDKLFKCESYTYRAYAIISDVTYYGDYVAFDTLCDDGNNPGDDISEGDPTVPIIPIEPEPEIPPFEWEPEEDEPYPPWDWTPPEWNQPDYPGLDWTIDFYYRKPYTKKDLDELRKKCIIYNKNSIEFALVLRHNMNVLKEFFNMMTDYMSAEEYNDFTDLIPPQRLKELYLDPLNPVDFRDMINGFIRNTVDNNIAVNRNFKLIQDGLSDYETETDDAYFREITTSIKPLQQDNPDVERMKGLINNLNYEVASNFNEIMRNLEILRAKLL